MRAEALRYSFVTKIVTVLTFSLIMGVCAGTQARAGEAAYDWGKGFEVTATLTGHEQGLVGSVFSPCGKYLTLASNDFFLDIWNAASGESIVRMKGLNTWPQYVAYSPDGTVLAAGDYEKVRLWKVPTGEVLMVLEGGDGPIAWHPDGTRLATKSRPPGGGYQLKLFAFPSGEVVGTGSETHPKVVRQVSWNPDGSVLASSSDDGTLKMWDGNTMKLLRSLAGEGRVRNFCFSPNGKYVAAVSGEDPGSFFKPAVVLVWDVSTGKRVLSLEDFEKGLEPLRFSPDGKTLATGERGPRARLWDIPSGKMVREYPGHKYWVSGLAFSPDGRFLAAITADEVVMWDAGGGDKLWSEVAASQGLTSVVFSPDGSRLVVTSTDNTAKIFEVKR